MTSKLPSDDQCLIDPRCVTEAGHNGRCLIPGEGEPFPRRIDEQRIWLAVLDYARLSHQMWTGALPEKKSLNERDPDAWKRCLREIVASIATEGATR